MQLQPITHPKASALGVKNAIIMGRADVDRTPRSVLDFAIQHQAYSKEDKVIVWVICYDDPVMIHPVQIDALSNFLRRRFSTLH